jgi:xyloglucan-specific endo-beta-1,4-glucanase
MLFSAILLAASATTALAQLKGNMCGEQEGYSASGYRVQNNLWGKSAATSGSQCTAFNSASGSSVAWSTTWQWAGGDNNVKSYSYSSRDFNKKLVSQISSIPTTAVWTVSNQNTRSNVAYDLFTAADINHPTSGGDYELMIWLGRYGGVQPIGSYKTTVNLAGRSWSLYVGYNGSMKVFSFVAPGAVSNFSGNIKEFFNYMASNEGFPAQSQNLISELFLSLSVAHVSRANVLGRSFPVWHRALYWVEEHFRCFALVWRGLLESEMRALVA